MPVIWLTASIAAAKPDAVPMKLRRDRPARAAALEAEISVSLEGIRNGHYIDMCNGIIAHVSTPNHTVTADDYFDVALPETPCPVFNVHLSKIGLLGHATGPVVKTCQLYEGVCLELRFIRERHTRLPLNAQQLAGIHKAVKVQFEEILKTGEVAISQLQAQTLRWWQRLGRELRRRYGSRAAIPPDGERARLQGRVGGP
jgi:hypothetical protein